MRGRALPPRAEVPPPRLPEVPWNLARQPFWAQTPDEARFFIEVAKHLHDLCYDDDSETTITAIAEEANLSTQTVFNLLQGKTWGDLPSIYRLEVALRARLWVNPDVPANP